jgi:hypothetical protein
VLLLCPKLVAQLQEFNKMTRMTMMSQRRGWWTVRFCLAEAAVSDIEG